MAFAHRFHTAPGHKVVRARRRQASSFRSPRRLSAFSQCPAVGNDTSCGVLVTVTDSGTQVQSDPSQGPFDGVEDTLIGVQNNSSGSIGSLVLSANTDLFGFDSDGLCSGVNSGGITPFTPPPSGCPFGPTGYEGPGTSFSNINPSSTGGIVNFNPAIAPGGSAYFSLEEALTQGTVFGGGPGTGEQGGPSNPSEHPVGCSKGRPVNCATGVFWHRWDDLRVPGRGVPLDFQRTYSSAAAATDGPLGFGWTHSYNMSLAVDPSSGNVTVTQEDDATVTFNPNGSGGYVAPPRVLATLVKNGDGTYTFTRNADLVHYTFSAAGQLLKEVDRNGYTTTLGYNGSQLASVTDPAGRSFSFTYSGSHIASVTGPGSHTESFTYDGSGNLASATDPAGGKWSFTYDSSHRLLTMTDPRGGATTNVYDASGRVTSQTDPMSRTTTWSYSGNPGSPAGGTTTVTDPKGNVTSLSFQNLELLSKTAAAGTGLAATTSYTYDPATLGITSITDPDNHTSTATYDASGNQISSTDALSRKTTTSYNSLNEPLATTDPSNVTTTRSYDANGNLLSVSRPLNGTQTWTTTYSYGDASHPGDLTGITDANGHTTTLTYDGQGDLASITDAVGDKTTYAYDVLGELTSRVSARGSTTSYVYDALERVTQTTDPLAHISKRTYDANSNLASSTDADGNVTTYTYDADNELTKITRADGSTLQYGYDGEGNQTSQTNGAGKTTTYAYDAVGRLSTATDPLNRVTTYAYDLASNRTSITDPAGNKTTYGHDAANELTSIAYSDGKTPNVSFTYTANALRATMADGTGTTSYTYDQLNRLVSLTNGAGQTVTYGYDLAGNLTSLGYPNGMLVSRSYDNANRLTSVTDWLGHKTTFTVDPDNNTTAIAYANGITASTVFDVADQASSITDKNPAGTTLAGFTYTRDSNGQLTGTTPSGSGQGSNESYTYTKLNQLATLNSSSYTYDAAYNITKLANGSTLGYDAANEVTSFTPAGGSATQLSYDQRGNRLKGVNGLSFAYDQENRLTSSSSGSGGGSTAGLIAGGEFHSLAVKSDGTVWGWGNNADGELGDGTTTNRTTPVQVSGVSGASAVAAGDLHSLALTSGGAVRSWGWNGYGQLGDGTTTTRTTSVQVSGLSGVTAVAAGNYHSLALRSDGTVAAWGFNGAGELGDGTLTTRTTPITVQGLSGVTAIAGGGLPGFAGHSAALKSDGTVWTWGYNKHGQLGIGSTSSTTAPQKVALSGVTAIAANGDNTYALKSDGTVWAWGDDGYGQLGNTSVRGSQSTTPVQVAISGVAAIAAGGTHVLALKKDGTVWGWGNNNTGELGDGGACGKTCTTPVQINLANVAVLAAGYVHSLAALNDGTVRAWGRNAEGELGDGTTTVRLTPVTTSGLSGIKPAGASSTYTYDGDGLRAAKTSAGTTSHFAWSFAGSVPLLLTNGSTSYVYDDNGLPIEQIDSGGSVVYYQHDQLGSTRLLTDGTGAVAATYAYDPYGNLTSHTGSADTPLRFAGQYQDADTGLYYMRARYYDPQTAQFLGRDPILPITQEPYGYVAGNPLNFVDFTGLGDCPWYDPFCWPGDVEHAISWAWDHPIQAIGLAATTATLVITLGTDAPEVFALDFAIVDTAEGSALSISVAEGTLEESGILSVLSKISKLSGFVDTAQNCLFKRDATACAWNIAGLIAPYFTSLDPNELHRAVYDWLIEVGGLFVPESDPSNPCPA